MKRSGRLPDLGRVLLAAALAIGFAMPARAEDVAGTRSPFAHGAGGRALGMGGAFVASADDASAVIWNPGGLAGIERAAFEASYGRFGVSDAGEHFVAVVMPSWRWGVFGVSLRHLGVSGVEQRDDRNVVIPGEIGSSESELALGYARAVVPGVDVGAALKLQRVSLGELAGTGFGSDLGVRFDGERLLGERWAWTAPLSVGLAVRNLLVPEQRLDREAVPDPRLVRLGLAWHRELSGSVLLRVAAEVEKASGFTRPHVGTEMTFGRLMALRTGLSGGNLAVGTSLRWNGLSVDYVQEQRDVGWVTRVGLSKSMGPTVTQSREANRLTQERALAQRLEQVYEARLTDQVVGLLARAEESRAAGRFDEALEALGAARALAPGDTRAARLELEMLLEQGAHLEQSGDPAGAALSYSRVLEAWPQDSVAAAGRSRAEAKLARRASQSSHAQEMDEAYRLFGTGDILSARSAFRRLAAAMPGDSATVGMLRRIETTLARRTAALLERIGSDVEAGRLDEARRGIEEASGLGVTDRDLAALRSALDQRERHDASPRPKPGVRTAPNAPTAAQHREADQHYRRGLGLAAANQTDNALRFWELAVSLDPHHAGAREALKKEYLLRGMVAFGRGRFRDAERHWNRVVELDPSDARAKGYLARARTQIERTRELTGAP